jgi:D-galactonate transporter
MPPTISPASDGHATARSAAIEERAYRKVTWRLIPFLFLCYLVAYLDRVNVGFAKLQMLADIRMSDTAYGVGAGIFFIGYFLFEVPSNLILHRVGARVWIARIMITWGLLSASMMLVRTVPQFYAVRFALGLAEAGFFPGIVYYLSRWYPAARRARVTAWFMTALAASGVVGGPLSGWILSAMSGRNGWAGWQWLFLLEGIPSVLVGVAVYAVLPNSIQSAKWLSPEERTLLQGNVDAEQNVGVHLSLLDTLRDSRVVVLAALSFSIVMGVYGIGFWLPQLIRSMGVQDALRVGLLSAIPYGAAAVAMVLTGRSSDRHGERRWHLVGAALVGALGFAVAARFPTDVVVGMIALSAGTASVLTTLPLMWTLPPTFLRGASAAAGIGAINSVGNLSGFLSPYMIGAVTDATGSASSGVYVIAAFQCAAALLAIPATRALRQRRA